MLKNSVFTPSVDTVGWMKSAGVRAVKTIAQAAVAGIGTAAVMGQVNWQYAISASALAGVLSLLTSIAGLPEVPNQERKVK